MTLTVWPQDRAWVSFKSGAGTAVFVETGTAQFSVRDSDDDDHDSETFLVRLHVGPYFRNVLQVAPLVYPMSFNGEGRIAVESPRWELSRYDPPGGDQVLIHFNVALLNTWVGAIGYQVTVEAGEVLGDAEGRYGETQQLIG